MKKIALMSVAFMFGLAAMAQPKADDVMKMNTEKHDFGKIKQNVPVTYFFEIKNTSDRPIVVENTSASCGCTIPEKPEQPIEPGKSGKLKVEYNASAVGVFNKEIYIKLAGIEQQKTIYITGTVVAQ